MIGCAAPMCRSYLVKRVARLFFPRSDNHIAAAAERGVTAEVDRAAIRERLQDVGTRLRDAGMVGAIRSQPQ